MNSLTLLELAKEEFGEDLTEAEQKLFRATAKGEMADYGEGDPAKANEWDDDRVLQADRIEWLCTDPKATREITHRRILIKGARIEGEIGLSSAKIDFVLAIVDSALPDGIDLQLAHLHALILNGTHTGPISADALQVEHGVFMREGFHAVGHVALRGATIGGNLDCHDGSFCNAGGPALTADGANIRGAVFMNDGFHAEGEVRLVAARIGGILQCTAGNFINTGKTALNVNEIDVQGSVLLTDGFRANGEVRFNNANIGGALDCTKGIFLNPTARALSVESAAVSGHVLLREGFQPEGEVNFTATKIGEGFQWIKVTRPDRCKLFLESTRVGTLWDDEASWPPVLHLDGFVYDRLDNHSPLDSAVRLRWLGRQDYKDFVPQPYVQLAKVLQAMGHEGDARRILIAKHEDRARVKAMTFGRWIWHIVLGSTIGYGYRPWRAARWIFVFILFGVLFFGRGFAAGEFQETKAARFEPTRAATDNQSKPGESAQSKAGTAPAFNAFVYSLDSFVPIIDLHQAKYRLPTGPWLRLYLWIHIGIGWALTTLLVVGLTGLVRK